MSAQVAVILKGYPRLSETFIAQEIRALEKRGIDLQLFSLRHPTESSVHPIHREIEAEVCYLPEYIRDDKKRVYRAWKKIRNNDGFKIARKQFLRDLKRDFTINRVRRFGQAMVLAAELPDSINHLYSHFMHTPASVTYYASLINQMSWSISAHAKDIWTIENWEIREKLDSIDWLVTCTSANVSHLKGLAATPDKVSLLYHGLDFERFNEPSIAETARDGSNPDSCVRLVSVGRAVNKKGYDFLLKALAGLPEDLNWHFNHIGGGELLSELKLLADSLGISHCITWMGALPQTEVLALYRDSDLFVLPSRISDNGDRDGLPNVLMEAQSQQLACLSTNISGIPELIIHGETGWLVEQKDEMQLNSALSHLIKDPQLRMKLAEAGFQRVRQSFSLDSGIDQLVEKLTHSIDSPGIR